MLCLCHARFGGPLLLLEELHTSSHVVNYQTDRKRGGRERERERERDENQYMISRLQCLPILKDGQSGHPPRITQFLFVFRLFIIIIVLKSYYQVK